MTEDALRPLRVAIHEPCNEFIAKLRSQLAAERARAKAAEAQVARVRARHVNTPCPVPEKHEGCQDTGYCAGCGHAWPCEDIRALGYKPPALHLFVPNGPLLRIEDTTTWRVLLTLDVVDGRLTAIYEPTDLDDAAAMFARELARLAEPIVTGPTLGIFGSVEAPSEPADPLEPQVDGPSEVGSSPTSSGPRRKLAFSSIGASEPRRAREPSTAEQGSWKPEIFPIVDALRSLDWRGFDPYSLDDLADVAAVIADPQFGVAAALTEPANARSRCDAVHVAPHPDGRNLNGLNEWICHLPRGHKDEHAEGNYRWTTWGPIREIPAPEGGAQ